MAHSARSREVQEQLYAPAKQTHHNPKAKPLSSFAALSTDGPHNPLRRDLVQTKEGCKTLKLQVIQKFGSYPVCHSPDSVHLYTRAFPAWNGSIQWPSSRLTNCPTFAAKTKADRGHLINELKAFGRSSSWMHDATRCPLCGISCRATEKGRECGGSHLKELNGCPNIVMTVVLAQGSKQGSQKAHPLQQEEDRGASTVSACFTQH